MNHTERSGYLNTIRFWHERWEYERGRKRFYALLAALMWLTAFIEAVAR